MQDEGGGADSLESWIEWKARCALALCSEPTQRRLRDFAEARFSGMARRCAHNTNASVRDILVRGASQAWHLLESHLAVKSTRRGKRYKDWLFGRIGPDADPLDGIQGGATLIMRDVVRDFLRAEFNPRGIESLNAPLDDDPVRPLTLEDLLPAQADPTEEVARREYETLARRHATRVFRGMDRKERISLIAKALGLSLAHPDVARAAGCGKSVLSDAYVRFVQSMADGLKREYPDDDCEDVMRLSLLTLKTLRTRAFSWGKSEKGAARLFLYGRGT